MHWATHYIGKPYERGNQGPDAFDCWSLVRHVMLHQFNIHVPVIDIPEDDRLRVMKAFMSHEELNNWNLVPQEEAQEGDCVELAHAKYPRHVGVWVHPTDDKPGLLHAVHSSGVVFSYVELLRVHGWTRMLFYRHASRV